MSSQSERLGVLKLAVSLMLVWALGMQIEVQIFSHPPIRPADLELSRSIPKLSEALAGSGSALIPDTQISAATTNTLLDFGLIVLYTLVFILLVNAYAGSRRRLGMIVRSIAIAAGACDIGENIGLIRILRGAEYVCFGSSVIQSSSSANSILRWTFDISAAKWCLLATTAALIGVLLCLRPRPTSHASAHVTSRMNDRFVGGLAIIAAIVMLVGLVGYVEAAELVRLKPLLPGGLLLLTLVLITLAWREREDSLPIKPAPVAGPPVDPMLQLATDFIYTVRGQNWDKQKIPLSAEIEEAITRTYGDSEPSVIERMISIWKWQDERAIELLATVFYRDPTLAKSVLNEIRKGCAVYLPVFIRELSTTTFRVINKPTTRLPWEKLQVRQVGPFAQGEQRDVTCRLINACAPGLLSEISPSVKTETEFCESLALVLIEKPLFMHWLARATGIAVPFSFVLEAELEELEISRSKRRKEDPDAFSAALEKMEAQLRTYSEQYQRTQKPSPTQAKQRRHSTTTAGASGNQALLSSGTSAGAAPASTQPPPESLPPKTDGAQFEFLRIATARLEYLKSQKPSLPTAPADSMVPAPYENAPRDGSGGREFPVRRAFNANLFGIGFSGGGIRSATFNLGVLQALAEADVLRYVDYLSAVSGGSYIAGWLAAWCKRQANGVRRVQRWLAPWRSPDPRNKELRPIWFLRQYSNYLTPLATMFSADTWTAVAIWIRNTVLNQLVLILLLIALLALPWFALTVIQQGFSPSTIMIPICIWAAVAVTIGRGLASFERDSSGALRPAPLPVWLSGQAAVQATAVIPLLVCAFLAITVADDQHWLPVNVFWAASAVIFSGLVLAQISGRFQRCFVEHDLTAPSWWGRLGAFGAIAAFAAAAAGVGGALVMSLFSWIEHWPLDQHRYAITFGPPLLLLVVAAVIIVDVGLLGINFPDERREWWARFAGWTIIYSVALLVLFAISFFAKNVVGWLVSRWELKSSAIVAWLGSTLWAVLKGHSSSTAAKGTATSSMITRIGLTIVPYIFIVGLLLTVSYFITPLVGSPAPSWKVFETIVVAAVATFVLSWRFDVNEFSMHHFYRNRLMRAYLGASHVSRNPNPFTGFDRKDDVQLSRLQTQAKGIDPVTQATVARPYFGPYLLVNTALNVSHGEELAWQERKAESFVFAPLYSGFEYITERTKTNGRLEPFGYRWSADYAYRSGGIGLGTAMAISGAAVNPNMGYHSSSPLAFLMTLFNVRLGWWMGNPRHRSKWLRHSPRLGLMYLTTELTGSARGTSSYINLSDGGHFENLGLYELVRRRCRYIVLCDSEEDAKFDFGGLGNAVRKCRTDFNVEIQISLDDVRPIELGDDSRVHCVFGNIFYPGPRRERGYLLYIKSSLTGDDEPADVREYGWHNRAFPHQSTADQWFSESQFESYRTLGHHIGEVALAGIGPCRIGSDPNLWIADMFRDLESRWGAAAANQIETRRVYLGQTGR